jgi:hypothetical protein
MIYSDKKINSIESTYYIQTTHRLNDKNDATNFSFIFDNGYVAVQKKNMKGGHGLWCYAGMQQ